MNYRILWSLILIVLFAVPVHAADTRTLIRTEDCVVVTGESLAPLAGAAIEQLSLQVYDGRAFHPVPFQIDERKPDGSFAYLSGRGASPDPESGLDANDELAFMVGDGGDRAGGLPLNARQVLELEIVETNGGRAWVYLCRYDGAAPRAEGDYVSYREAPESNRKVFDGQTVTLGYPRDAFFGDELHMKTGHGAGPDLLDVWTFRGKVDPSIWFPVKLEMDTMLKDDPVAWTDGAVRVLYEGEGYVKLSFLKIKANNINRLEFCRSALHMHQEFSTPTNYDKLIDSSDVQVYMAFNENMTGNRVYDANTPETLVFDGVCSAPERSRDAKRISEWFVSYGPAGNIVYRPVFTLPSWKPVNTRLFYKEDRPGQPECEVGTYNAGFHLDGLENVADNKGIFDVYCYFPATFQPGDERRFLNILDKPLQVKSRAL